MVEGPIGENGQCGEADLPEPDAAALHAVGDGNHPQVPVSDGVDLGSQYLRATKAGGVLRVVLDRPERRNACTIEMYHGIKKAAVLAERDPDVDVLVLTGAGDYFCVGGEMGGKHEGGQPLDRETDGIDLTPFVQLERCPKLVLIAINGMCQGGGLVMTLMSDLSVVSDRATFRVPELLRGVADCYLGARLAAASAWRGRSSCCSRRSLLGGRSARHGTRLRVVPHDQLEAAVAGDDRLDPPDRPARPDVAQARPEPAAPAARLAHVRRVARLGRGPRGLPGVRREASAALGALSFPATHPSTRCSTCAW